MKHQAIFELGIILLFGGFLNILFADEYVRYVPSLYSAKTVRVTGWVGLCFAIVLIGVSFLVK